MTGLDVSAASTRCETAVKSVAPSHFLLPSKLSFVVLVRNRTETEGANVPTFESWQPFPPHFRTVKFPAIYLSSVTSASQKFKELVQEHGTTVQNGLAQIQDIKGRWLPELLELVDKINETFRVNFAEIGCAVSLPSPPFSPWHTPAQRPDEPLGLQGEVVLHQGKDNQGQDDFEKFEIQIRVKFRDEEDLQVNRSPGFPWNDKCTASSAG